VARLDIPRPTRASLPLAAIAITSIAIGTLVVAALETWTDIPDASAVYLVAVVVVGWLGGTWPALGTAVASFVVYDILFTNPRFSLVVADPVELLNLVLVLIVALAVGRLAALGHERATEADRRATEATASFAISRLLATADSTASALPVITARLARDVPLRRAWVTLEAPGRDRPRTAADTGSGSTPAPTLVTTLIRMPGDEPARWVRAHAPAAHQGPPPGAATGGQGTAIRVKIETGGTVWGAVWGLLSGSEVAPDPAATRLMALAADQLALALRRDQLRDDAVRAEVARRSDAFKSALLESVSHDLRTPLASIRATADNLADPASEPSPAEVRAAAEGIDVEVERLDRLVRSVLDLSRIGSGTLAPDLEVHDLTVLVESAIGRARQTLGNRTITFGPPPEPCLVLVDAVLLDTAIANVLDNIARHTPDRTRVEIAIDRPQPDRVRLTIEDDGPGVPDDELEAIFDRFRRGATTTGDAGARRGMGIGLSIVRGMSEAMGGTATARRGSLGGLAVVLDLPAAPEPPVEGAT
jgi:two-component system sensor histidine kinase KdpD